MARARLTARATPTSWTRRRRTASTCRTRAAPARAPRARARSPPARLTSRTAPSSMRPDGPGLRADVRDLPHLGLHDRDPHGGGALLSTPHLAHHNQPAGERLSAYA